MPPESKSNRRWFRFSLRTFFVLLTGFCVWLGWQVHRAKQQQEAVEWVEAQHGKVLSDLQILYDYEIDEDGLLTPNAQPSGPEWLRRILGRHFFDEVRWLRLDGTDVSDITPVSNLQNLEVLNLGETRVSDPTPLANLTSLEILTLDHTPILSVAPLTNLTRLEVLRLSGTQVRDLSPVENLTNLKRIDLNHTLISEEQVKSLQEALPNCNINWTPFSAVDPP